ncbi:unnamed protein product [Acanthoscelides obtectus]|uniref:PiggyBac transposable element-derived protein domain-containing protein n=1 Tax=Acanthoscelides obtectus TaxID=200917 RepID=A0A9P0LS35_ACAOB|nr:unnamed protein product [Acanthoscelides obtectus]CAK1677145.1 PiggyBac transposable element-derived protein 4 [Acanthoscelides obtectus]
MLIKSDKMDRHNTNHISPENINIIKKIIDDFENSNIPGKPKKKRRSKKISNSDSLIHKYKRSQISPKTACSYDGNLLDGNLKKFKPSLSLEDGLEKETDVYINFAEHCDTENADANAFRGRHKQPRKSVYNNKNDACLDDYKSLRDTKVHQERVKQNVKEIKSNSDSLIYTCTSQVSDKFKRSASKGNTKNQKSDSSLITANSNHSSFLNKVECMRKTRAYRERIKGNINENWKTPVPLYASVGNSVRVEDSSEDDDEDYEALEGEVETNGNEDDDVLEAGVQEAQGERSWSEPSCDLFNFDCNKTNAVSQHCLMLLEHTEKTPLDFYNLFLDDEIMDLIVSNTNLYATQELCKLIAREEITTGSRYNAWTDTNREEMKIFIAFLLWMGLDRKPEIRDYWKKHILYKNDVSCYISRNRFELLLGFIHFADNEMASPDNRLYKIEHLLRLLNNKFSIMFEPGEKITIDESMIPFRGRIKFRQYIPSKRHKYGLKVYKVCLLGGYTWHAKVYTGKASSGNLTVTTRTTMELMEPLLDQGRTLFTDSFYTSVELAEELLKRKTHLLGTLRVNRKHNPHGVTKAKLRRGDMKYLQHSEKKIIIGKWKDKRDVLFLTTKQVPHLVEIESRGGRRMQKPSTIVDYNSAKGYIDLSDQMADCLHNIKESIGELKKSTLNGCWKNLWPEIVKSHAKVPDIRDEFKEIADLGKSLPGEGFDDTDDINQLFQSHNVELTERELIELTENNYEAQEKGEDDELVPAPKELTLKTLNKCFTMAHDLTELLIREHPTMQRSLKTKREVLQHWHHTRKLRINGVWIV